MRPPEFTPEQIIQAGNELQAIGRNITGFALRQKINGGNPTRLKQIWDEHLSGQAATKVEPVMELPIEVADEVAALTRELTDRIATLAVGLNHKTVKAAERRVAEVIRTAGEQREQAERELADAAATVEELETRLSEQQSRNESLSARLEELQAVHQTKAVEMAQLLERLAQTEQALAKAVQGADAERLQHLAQTEQLRAELHTAMARAESDRHAVVQETLVAREESARLRGQVDALQSQQSGLLRALEGRRSDVSGLPPPPPSA